VWDQESQTPPRYVEKKNAWILWQAFFVGIYFVGAALMFNTVRRSLNAIPAAT
jgi:hypothetical protein